MFVWPLLGLGAMIGGSLHLARRLEVRLTGDKGPEASSWVLREPSPRSLHLQPDELERDYWEGSRRELNMDI